MYELEKQIALHAAKVLSYFLQQYLESQLRIAQFEPGIEIPANSCRVPPTTNSTHVLSVFGLFFAKTNALLHRTNVKTSENTNHPLNRNFSNEQNFRDTHTATLELINSCVQTQLLRP